MSTIPDTNPLTRAAVLRIALVYALAGVLWILVSDRAVEWLFDDPQLRVLVSMVKGWAYVGVTSVLLYGVLDRLVRRSRAFQDEHLRTLQLLGAIADSSEDAIYAKDREGRYLLCNRAACASVGLEPAQGIGRTDQELFPAGLADKLVENDRLVMALGRTESVEEEIETLGGRRFFLATKGPLRDADGRIVGTFGVSRDITRRVEMEHQLRKLAQAVEQSAESVLITDLQGRIEYVNAVFERNTGYQRDEILGRTATELLQSGLTSKETHDELWRTLAAGQTWRGEFHNRRKDGSIYIDAAVITPLRQPDGRISHYVAVHEDITARKRMREELDQYRHHLEALVTRRTAELEAARTAAEAASRAKSAFLANMSHEIRTPMNAIIGLTHLLQRDAATPQQRERLGHIDGAAHHLLGIISDVLDLSKIEAGRLQLEQQDFELSAVLGQVCSMIGETARSKGLQLCIDGDHVPLWLRGDPTRVRQALLNYAGNAVKFTEHGRITLRAELIEDSGADLLVRFSVEDTGIGIDERELPRLFDAFEQADASTTRRHGGTGLGLAITRRLALLMGGTADAHSQPGAGSTFWFTARLQRGSPVLPVKQPSQANATPAVAAPAAQDPTDTLMLARLGAIDGVDVAQGLARVGDRTDRYLALWRQFFDLHDQDIRQISDCLAQQRPDQALRLVQTLRGSAAMLGATALASAARDLARALAAPDIAPQALPPLLDGLQQRLIPLLQLASSRTEVAAVMSAASAQPLDAATLAQLLGLLDEGDTAVLTHIEPYRPALPATLGDDHAAFLQALQRFDFEAARTLLAQHTDA